MQNLENSFRKITAQRLSKPVKCESESNRKAIKTSRVRIIGIAKWCISTGRCLLLHSPVGSRSGGPEEGRQRDASSEATTATTNAVSGRRGTPAADAPATALCFGAVPRGGATSCRD